MDGPSADALRRSLEQGHGGQIGARRPLVHRLLLYTHLLLTEICHTHLAFTL